MPGRRHRATVGVRAAALGLLLAIGGSTALAGSLAQTFCEATPQRTAAQQDRLLRFAAVVKDTLAASDARVALVSRSGLDLRRFDIRYSHAGLALKASDASPWAVRQLYFACDEGRPRLYDQGLAGFVAGTEDPALGHISLLLLPAEAAAAVEQAALDRPRALRLLAARYSANAHAWSLRYQNCNQWVAELLASAWGGLDDGADLRARAQAWLAEAGYAPAAVQVPSLAMRVAAAFVPWLHADDHPDDDRAAMRFRTSLPASIEQFVRERVPGAERIELCHGDGGVVVRRGWEPIAEGCRAAAGDRVIALDD